MLAGELLEPFVVASLHKEVYLSTKSPVTGRTELQNTLQSLSSICFEEKQFLKPIPKKQNCKKIQSLYWFITKS